MQKLKESFNTAKTAEKNSKESLENSYRVNKRTSNKDYKEKRR